MTRRPETPQDVVAILRTADMATLFMDSQPMADVIEPLVDLQRSVRAFLDAVDDVIVTGRGMPLPTVTLTATVSNDLLLSLLGALAHDADRDE